jgi:hypothetical protein
MLCCLLFARLRCVCELCRRVDDERCAGPGCRFVECEPDVLRLCLQPDDRLVSADAPAGPCCLHLLCTPLL